MRPEYTYLGNFKIFFSSIARNAAWAIYNFQAKDYTTIASMRYSRNVSCIVYVKSFGRVYIFGGFGNVLAECESYDFSCDLWAAVPDVPAGS